MIDSSAYQRVAVVRAGNGYQADLHDFHITPDGVGVLTVFSPIHCNLSSAGGPTASAATDAIFQDIDIKTGLVRSEWHSLDHVGLNESYSSARSASTLWPFDYFHINSLDLEPNGNMLISARNTWAVYTLDGSTGQVLDRIGGRASDYKLGAQTATAWQHDATLRPDGTITIFDNGANPPVHEQSRGLVIQVDQQHGKVSFICQFTHPTPLIAGSQGNVQTLPNGNVLVGWGGSPYFSEYGPTGTILFDGHVGHAAQSYRVYRFAWTGAPSGPPSIAVSAKLGGRLTVRASWNGTTAVTAWRVLAGTSGRRLATVATTPRQGFETTVVTGSRGPYVEAQALDASAHTLGTSKMQRG